MTSNEVHKLAAIVFTDIVGYTSKMEEDEKQTMKLLQTQREIIFPVVKEFGGEVIKEIGDGLMMMFDSAVQAVRFAVKVQTTLKDHELTIRAGIHLGEVIFKDGDVFGSAVNVAARIEPMAPPNGIAISENVRAQLYNKTDIELRPLGEKSLKGVRMPMSIYEVLLEGISEKERYSFNSLINDLWKRRVFQILAGYILGSWVIKWAVDAITTRYLLSPYLVDLSWVILLSLIPAVILLSYFHGRRKDAKWTKIELFGLPANAFLSVIIAVIMFNGKDLGAATSQVVVEDENGNTIERTIPKSEFMQSLTFFYFKNESGDTAYNWLQYGIANAIEIDLSQNMMIKMINPSVFQPKLKSSGIEDGVGVPLGLMKEIAGIYKLKYFLRGHFKVEKDEFIVVTELYRSKNAALVNSFTMRGEDIFNIIDEISVALLKEMHLSGDNILASSSNLPVSDVYTSSQEAFKNYIKANVKLSFDNDYEGSRTLLEKALEEDADFVLARFQLGMVEFWSNNNKRAAELLKDVINEKFRMTEKMHFTAKFIYYFISMESDKSMAVLKMWAELYPYDIDVHELLSERYQFSGQYTLAIDEYKKILRLDPEQTNNYRYIGSLYRFIGETDSALHYYEVYRNIHRDDYRIYRDLAELYLSLPDFNLASEYIDDAMILDPSNVGLAILQLDIEWKLGNFTGIEEKYLNLFEICTTERDSSQVLEVLSTYYGLIGQAEKSLAYHLKYIHSLESVLTPLNHIVIQLFHVDKYIKAGHAEEALQVIQSGEKKFEAPLNKVVAFGYLFYYLYTDEVLKAEPYLIDAKEMALGYGEDILLSNVYFVEGHIFEEKKMYDQAVESFQKFLDMIPNNKALYKNIARCYRKAEKLEMAEESIKIALKFFPNNPEVNYEAYLVFKKLNKQKEALDCLMTATDIWKNADADFHEAVVAQAALKEEMLNE